MLAPAEVGTREHILQWLAKKPAAEKYNWYSPRDCACGQYAREHLAGRSWTTYDFFNWGGHPEIDGCGLYPGADNLNALAQKEPRTFGSLYERALKAWS